MTIFSSPMYSANSFHQRQQTKQNPRAAERKYLLYVRRDSKIFNEFVQHTLECNCLKRLKEVWGSCSYKIVLIKKRVYVSIYAKIAPSPQWISNNFLKTNYQMLFLPNFLSWNCGFDNNVWLSEVKICPTHFTPVEPISIL